MSFTDSGVQIAPGSPVNRKKSPSCLIAFSSIHRALYMARPTVIAVMQRSKCWQ